MRSLRKVGLVVIVGASCLAGGPAPAQVVPLGPEFRVNSYTTGSQQRAWVASAGDGRFVVVWDGQGDVSGQRYDSAGNAAGSEFRVNSYTTGHQYGASVASAADGRFVVVWTSFGQDGSFYGVFGQRYDSAGSPSGSEFRVNSYTTGHQRLPSVASAADGRFVVVWNGEGQDGGGTFGVFGQRYDSAGSPAGPEFRVNSYTTGTQQRASAASADDGRAVVAWESIGQDGSTFGVFGQRYDSAGSPAGPEFRVNSYTPLSQVLPSVASAPDGRFVVTWYSEQDGSVTGVFGQRYDSAGSPSGPEFQVNSYTTGQQRYPSVAPSADGRFVVAWEGPGPGDVSDIFGRRFGDELIFGDGFETAP
jgi:hypothetical protein